MARDVHLTFQALLVAVVLYALIPFPPFGTRSLGTQYYQRER